MPTLKEVQTQKVSAMIGLIKDAKARGDEANVTWHRTRAHTYAECLRSCGILSIEEASALQGQAFTAQSSQDPTWGVRPAVASDLSFIQEWLANEQEQPGAGFINNWAMIESACCERTMLVYGAADGPVGFLTRGISIDTILQVRSDFQCRGIGRALVEHAMRLEEAQGNAVLMVQCEPKTSVAFWGAMGFETHRMREPQSLNSTIYMHHLSHTLHGHSRRPDVVTFEVYPSRVLYERKEVRPDRVYHVTASPNLEARALELSRRFALADEPLLEDAVVVIHWGGMEVFRGKAKHQGAAACGFVQSKNGLGWYIDVVHVPDVL
ncbi:GNAT family N-acetyltransferase [Pseudomonas guariconensis]|uniref:GNAT family N-acetyltransferase n=1 Tax=Pseudomonas guariconensis TaxID=1288410 RepID=UPI0039064C60